MVGKVCRNWRQENLIRGFLEEHSHKLRSKARKMSFRRTDYVDPAILNGKIDVINREIRKK